MIRGPDNHQPGGVGRQPVNERVEPERLLDPEAVPLLQPRPLEVLPDPHHVLREALADLLQHVDPGATQERVEKVVDSQEEAVEGGSIGWAPDVKLGMINSYRVTFFVLLTGNC